jgi:hypothetical protein
MGILSELLQAESWSAAQWRQALERAAEIQDYIAEQTYQTRKKDYDNPFRWITCRNDAERDAVLGTVEDNQFVQQVRGETAAFRDRIDAAVKRATD